MKKISVFLAAAALAGTLAFTAATVLPIGSDMPLSTHKMKDISGKEVTIKDAAKGNGVLVMFSCNTCPYVVKNEQRTLAVCEFAQKVNVGVVIVNSNEAYRASEDSYDAMKSYASEKKYNWYYLMDTNSEVADAFGANRTPECFLFNKDMKLVYHGAIDDSPSDETAVKRQHLREAMTQMADGKEITVKESKSVGCSIKRKAKS